MQVSTILSVASLFLAATASPTPTEATELIQRQSNNDPVPTATLYIGACLAIGTCYYNGNEGCLTHGCNNETMLGSVCSCNADVQKAIDVQNAKGRAEWPVKCPYKM